jgi:UDP-N-acetylglucosamine 2-epimerase (non-hydrolysing)
MTAFDALLDERPPALVVVVGDVNSTMACSLVASKRGIPVAHVEAGLRSRDRAMPEEINRLVTDAVSDLLFATSPDAVENLVSEGVDRTRIHLVGNPMIDTLLRHVDAARARGAERQFGLTRQRYALVTLHRPSNVDGVESLRAILDALEGLATRLPVLFPVHPRTRARVARIGFAASSRLTLTEPLGYLDFLGLMEAARLVLTDSGGIQEETTALGVPCLTLRDSTERPITVTEGTNLLLGSDPRAILPAAEEVLGAAPGPPARGPALWDGHAGARIAAVLAGFLEKTPAGNRLRAGMPTNAV